VIDELERRLDDLPATADPRVGALHATWLSLCENGLPPDRERLDVFALRRWLGHISIYEAIDGGADFRIRLEGTRISQMTGEDWTGRRASEVDATFGTKLLPSMQHSLRTGSASVHATRIFQREFKTAIRLLLPVRSRPGAAVDQIFLVIYLDPGQRP
jgi:hypothetical protein